MTERPLAIDLFTGLHGWSEGLVAEGFRVVGFDIEDMCAQFGEPRPEYVELVLEDVLTLHGSRFADATLIVASPPCQEYSYMAMPWSRAKAKAAAIRADETGAELERLNRLLNACFRIKREASEAAGHDIPLIVENVRGAIPWVGRSRYNFGSFHLWGDVPALMPRVSRARLKVREGEEWNVNRPNFTGTLGWDDGVKVPGLNWSDRSRTGQAFNTITRTREIADQDGRKAPGGTQWLNDGPRTPDSLASTGSKSKARKAASARIAKIPSTLSRYIARVHMPRDGK